MRKSGWFTMTAPQAMGDGGDGTVVRIDVFGEIGWEVSGSQFLRELRDLGDVNEIRLHIHSPGGSVLDGWAIANGLMSHPAKVVARVEGMAASMASVIACAADVLEMPENAYLMIHNVSGGAWGEAEELQSMVNLILQLQTDVAKFYAKRTGLEVSAVEELMAAETWMNGADAVDAGFADVVLEPVAAAAVTADLPVGFAERFEHAPDEVLSNVGGPNEPPAEEEKDDDAAEESAGDGAAGGAETETDEGAGDAAEDPAADDDDSSSSADSPADEEGEGEESPGGIISNFMARLRGGRAGENGAGLVSARADVTRLTGELETATNRATAAESALKAANADLTKLRNQERDLAAVIAEVGFSISDSADLPAGDDGDGTVSGLNAWEEFQQMTKGPERSKFYKENRKAILAAQAKEPAAG